MAPVMTSPPRAPRALLFASLLTLAPLALMASCEEQAPHATAPPAPGGGAPAGGAQEGGAPTTEPPTTEPPTTEPPTTEPPTTEPLTKSPKRGVASAFASEADLAALSRGVSWWYNWSPSYGEGGAGLHARGDVAFVPMTWNGNNPQELRAFFEAHPEVRHLLTFNEPNFRDQANLTPSYAASLWPTFEQLAEELQLELVGPALNYCGGCVVVDGAPIASPFTVWMDMFLESFEEQFGRPPRMDYTALHWYDYGLEEQVEEMVTRYGKPVWVTEFALWRAEDWCTDELERQWLIDMVSYLEAHPMVYRYAWFTARRPDFPKINLLGAEGELTPLGEAYVSAPF